MSKKPIFGPIEKFIPDPHTEFIPDPLIHPKYDPLCPKTLKKQKKKNSQTVRTLVHTPRVHPRPLDTPKVWSPTLPYVQKPWKTEKKNLFQTLGHTPRIHSRPPDTPPVPAGPFWPAPLATNQAQNGFMDFAWPEHTKTTLTWLQPSATPKPSNQSPLRWLEMNQGGVTHNRYFMVSQVPGTRNGCKTHLGISTKFRDYLMDRKSRLRYELFLSIKKSINP